MSKNYLIRLNTLYYNSLFYKLNGIFFLIKLLLLNIKFFKKIFFFKTLYLEKEALKNIDLFIVTSCTDTSRNSQIVKKLYKNLPFNNDESYSHNQQHTKKERLHELIEGIKSIRKNFKNCMIINIENSTLTKIDKNKINHYVDLHLDYSKDKFIIGARKHVNKGVPWLAKLVKFFIEEQKLLNYKKIHFVCGRYIFKENISKKYSNNGFYFFQPRNVDTNEVLKKNQFSTRYFFIINMSVQSIFKKFRKAFVFSILGYSVEDSIITSDNKDLHKLKKLGIYGKVNGIFDIIE